MTRVSSHNCRVTATISLKDGVTDDEVRKALEPFLDEHNLDFDEQVCVGNIEITDGKLCLHLDVFGDGADDWLAMPTAIQRESSNAKVEWPCAASCARSISSDGFDG